jgi:hypothetical protein
MDHRTDVRAGWTCTTSASTSLPLVPAYAVSPISTAAGSAGYRTGTTALVSCRTAHASPAERAAGVLLG